MPRHSMKSLMFSFINTSMSSFYLYMKQISLSKFIAMLKNRQSSKYENTYKTSMYTLKILDHHHHNMKSVSIHVFDKGLSMQLPNCSILCFLLPCNWTPVRVYLHLISEWIQGYYNGYTQVNYACFKKKSISRKEKRKKKNIILGWCKKGRDKVISR